MGIWRAAACSASSAYVHCASSEPTRAFSYLSRASLLFAYGSFSIYLYVLFYVNGFCIAGDIFLHYSCALTEGLSFK